MSEERKLILNLLVEGKITSDEADELLEALERTPPRSSKNLKPAPNRPPRNPGRVLARRCRE